MDLPSEAEPFGAEVRRESFYVSTSPDALVLGAKQPGEYGTGYVAIKAEHIPAFLVALAAVHEFPAYRRWLTEEGGVEREPTDDPWTLHREPGRVVLSGPMYLFGVGTDWQLTQSVELMYEDLPHLRGVLAEALAGSD